MAEPVISMQIETIIEFEPDTDISHLFVDNVLKLIKDEIDKGYSNLKEIKERLPKDISYSLIRIAAAKYRTRFIRQV